MEEKRPIDISKKRAPISMSKSQTGVAKNNTPQKPENVKKVGDKSVNHNVDGTFSEGNDAWKNRDPNKAHRPIQDFSYKSMAKVRAAKDPSRVEKDLDMLDKIIDNEDASPMERMKAIEYKIKLNGNFDAQETRDVTERQIPDSPLNSLTVDELRSLRVLKERKK